MSEQQPPARPAPVPREPDPGMHARIADRYLFTMFREKKAEGKAP